MGHEVAHRRDVQAAFHDDDAHLARLGLVDHLDRVLGGERGGRLRCGRGLASAVTARPTRLVPVISFMSWRIVPVLPVTSSTASDTEPRSCP